MPLNNDTKEMSIGSDDCNSSDDGSGNEESTTVSSKHHEDSSGNKEEVVIARQETRAVWRLKFAVILVLAVSAVAVAATTYFYLTWSQEDQFAKQFEEDKNKIFDAISRSLDKTFGLLDSVAVTWISAARMTNQTWPFVTISDFAVRMAKLVPLTDAININFLPVISPQNREAWEAYALTNVGWINKGVKVQSQWNGYFGQVVYDAPLIEQISGDFGPLEENINRIMTPVWQNFPVIPNLTWTYNYDWLSVSFPESYEVCLEKHTITMTKPYMIPTPGDTVAEAETKAWSEILRVYIGPDEEPMEPVCDITYPIINEIDQVTVAGAEDYDPADHKVVGMVGSTMYYRAMIRNILPKGSDGIDIVFSNPCTENDFTYQISGPSVKYRGVGDKHDKKYDRMGFHKKLTELSGLRKSTMYTGARPDDQFCPMTLHFYPSDVMKDRFTTRNPTLLTVGVICIFAFTVMIFFFYDMMVERRQKKVLSSAVRSSAIVSSLFPSTVRDRLYPEAQTKGKLDGHLPDTAKGMQNNFIRDRRSGAGVNGPERDLAGPAIAELYPDTTVLFADIAGFTAWSSVRNPCQVFQLLETLYGAFDAIARKRGVFKVETIGDCYVAAVGLPVPRKHHAVVMARFAMDIRDKMLEVVAGLDKSLGPGTGDLALRVGLNSGPTTAGVLRGEKSRFQLFGDTVNTAARMESNGERNKIQVSSKTAELLQAAGKDNWLTMRSDKIECKGKGLMTTYWCDPRANVASGSVVSGSDVSGSEDVRHEPTLVMDTMDLKTQRLVDWNVDLLQEMIQEVLSERAAKRSAHGHSQEKSAGSLLNLTGNPVDEVTDVLNLPNAPKNGTTSKLQVTEVVVRQLRDFVASIAGMYQANPFHNFDHCSHVTMSTKKLLGRIVGEEGGMTIDALTQFAIVFGAIIHDVDHPGVSNSQLVKENGSMAVKYSGQSVAEQNSVDLAWQMLMQSRFNELRTCLCPSKAELQRFRLVVVNVVMATDLFDKNLKALRDARWEKSFSAGSDDETLHGDDLMRRKTIVIELIIQASDVSHTMQHFTVYKKWNSNLMKEMYGAYQDGRLAKDPTDGWYEGELWFFDNYVIPLAQKLRECQVFGVSCDEFLDYAKDNRMEWEMKGRDIVQQAVQEFHVNRTAGINVEPFEI